MPLTWTPDQVLALAPDEASRKNASGLASPRKWLVLYRHESEDQRVLWGEIRGFGADPYCCQVDLNGPDYKCTCPSRKRPCKHALGIFLLFASQPGAFEASTPPDGLAQWLAKRAARNERAGVKGEGTEINGDSAASADAAAKVAEAKNRRAAQRDQKIRAGLDDLETWLCDLVRQGLASAQTQPRAFWETPAARLVDAQAPGLARLVRAMPDLAASGDGYQERLLDQVARLYLALEGYRRIDTLPEPHQADLRALVGISLKQEELRDCPGVSDTWLVMGSVVEEETGLTVQRTWLVGQSTRQPALVLSFAAGGPRGNDTPITLDASLTPGMALPAELVFYPGAFPLRALIRTREPAQAFPAQVPASGSLVEGTAGYAAALAAYPWLEHYPLALDGMIPLHENGDWSLLDSQGRCVALPRGFLHGWTLLALSGGAPLGVFGEWNGERLLPLSAWAEGRFLPL